MFALQDGREVLQVPRSVDDDTIEIGLSGYDG